MSGSKSSVDAPRMVRDAFFKQVFGDPKQAAGELAAVLPSLAGHLDWCTLAPAPTNFVTEVLSQRVGDLVFQGQLGGGDEVLVWFLVEHQSREDWWMSLRVAGVKVAMWDEWRKRNREARKLPPIVAVVVYHGKRAWRAPTDTRELCVISGPQGEALEAHGMRCHYVLDDLTLLDDDALKGRKLSALGALALLALAHGMAEDFIERLATRWQKELRDLADAGGEQLEMFLRYIMFVNPRASTVTMTRTLEPIAGARGKEAVMSVAEQLIQEGFEQGIKQGVEQGIKQGVEQGIKQGVEQGVEQGQRALLLALLEQRFGPLSAEHTARVAAADSRMLGHWARRVLIAERIGDVFRDTE